MKRESNDQLNKLFDLLKTCVDSGVAKHQYDEGVWQIQFQLAAKDERLKIFTQLVPGKWRPPALYRVSDFEFLNNDFLIFLDLTKLKTKQMQKLMAIDKRFEIYAKTLGLDSLLLEYEIFAIQDTVKVIDDNIKKSKITLRELSQAADLTQMSLHNYKKGANIRLQNFLNLLPILNLKMVLKNKDSHKP